MRKFVGMIVIAGLMSAPSALRAQATGGTGGGGGGAGGGIGSGGGIGGAAGGAAGAGRTGTTGAAGARGGAGSTTNAVPSTSNAFYGTYASPTAIGYPVATTGTSAAAGGGGSSGGGVGGGSSSSATGSGLAASKVFSYTTGANLTGTAAGAKAFGQPLYAVTSTAAASTISSVASGSGTGFNTVGIKKTPSYGSALSDDVPFQTHDLQAMEQNLRNVIARSSHLKSRDNVRVSIENNTIVLRGQVPSARDKRLAEAILRLTPGVVEVNNLIEAPVEKSYYPYDE